MQGQKEQDKSDPDSRQVGSLDPTHFNFAQENLVCSQILLFFDPTKCLNCSNLLQTHRNPNGSIFSES